MPQKTFDSNPFPYFLIITLFCIQRVAHSDDELYLPARRRRDTHKKKSRKPDRRSKLTSNYKK